jgi:sulfoxide reductase heme-binding subunit YedZ
MTRYYMTLLLITVKNPSQLHALTTQTYILGAVAGGIFLLAAAIIAHLIRFEGGSNPKDPGKRRQWFWAFMFLSFSTCFLYNMYIVSHTIAPNLQSKFITANITGSLICLATYLIAGFILSKTFSKGKFGSWFPSNKH